MNAASPIFLRVAVASERSEEGSSYRGKKQGRVSLAVFLSARVAVDDLERGRQITSAADTRDDDAVMHCGLAFNRSL